MTSWPALPIIGSAKYSVHISDKMHLGFGLLAGTSSWAHMSTAGALFYGPVTFGDHVNNFT